MYLASLDLIQFRGNDDRFVALSKNPLIHVFIIGRWLMTDINEQKDCFQLFGAMQIIFNHPPPFCLNLITDLCIAITRKIHQIQFLIDFIKINRLRLARLGRCSCQGFPVQQSVDQGRFSHIGFACKRHLRKLIVRKLAGNTTDGLQLCLFNDHMISFLPYANAWESTSSIVPA